VQNPGRESSRVAGICLQSIMRCGEQVLSEISIVQTPNVWPGRVQHHCQLSLGHIMCSARLLSQYIRHISGLIDVSGLDMLSRRPLLSVICPTALAVSLWDAESLGMSTT
jgi:hypothetical protein